MTDTKKDYFINSYKNILAPTKTLCQKDFTFSGYSYGEVFELAAGLKKTLSRRGEEETLCICTENKAVIAACILASLAGSCRLILPYAFSAHALSDMYDAVGFNFAIADHPEEMPAGVEIITPLAGKISDILMSRFSSFLPEGQRENQRSGQNHHVIYLPKLFI
jgi:hypothetical protein